MRLAPNTGTVPAGVSKFLLPHERQVISVNQHPAVLIRPIFEVLAGLAIAGWVSSSVAHGNNTVILVIWILWALLLLRLLWYAPLLYCVGGALWIVVRQRQLMLRS